MTRLGLALLLCWLAVAAPAPAARPYYVSLGDSLGAGYQKTADGTVVTRPGYTDVVLRAARDRRPRLRLKNVACAGETTLSFVSVDGCQGAGGGSQLTRAVAFMRTHRVAMVTISLGTNHFGPCFALDAVNRDCIRIGRAALRADLPGILRALRGAAGKRARMVALAPYDPFVAYYEQGDSGPLVRAIDRVVVRAARAERIEVVNAYDLFDSGNFKDGAALENLCAYTQMCLPAPQTNVHPSDAGYTLLGTTLAAALRF